MSDATHKCWQHWGKKRVDMLLEESLTCYGETDFNTVLIVLTGKLLMENEDLRRRLDGIWEEVNLLSRSIKLRELE